MRGPPTGEPGATQPRAAPSLETWPRGAVSGIPPAMLAQRVAPTLALACAVIGASALAIAGCKGGKDPGSKEGVVSLSGATPAGDKPLPDDPAMEPAPGGPRIGAVAMAAPLYQK